ncbi:MAG: ATP-binding protein [Burkholderiales bacterium]
MRRYLESSVHADLGKKMVFIAGPRQVGKTTLAKSVASGYSMAQYLNWDVPADSRIIAHQSWSQRADLLILDEIHKMKAWKAFLKGVFDGRPSGQALLVTGSARMDTFRQSRESLAGRYFSLRLHPISVAERVRASDEEPQAVLDRLLARGGFPEPFLAEQAIDADRWRKTYIEDLLREDILEFSRIHELRAMRLFVEMLRTRVGSPVSLASMARDLQISPNTAARFLEILEALFIIFAVRPFHTNIARAIRKEPKVYFYDTGLVEGEGARFENACATMLQKHVHFLEDVHGRSVSLNYIRDKDGREVDFVVAEGGVPIGLAECKLDSAAITPYLAALAERLPASGAVQLVRDLRQPEQRGRVAIEPAARWLAELAA